MKFKTKAVEVEVEAVRWECDAASAEDVKELGCAVRVDPLSKHLTLDNAGVMLEVLPWQYVVKTAAGEFLAREPHEFEATHERI